MFIKMASTLGQLNHRIEFRRNQVAWNMEVFLTKLRVMIRTNTLKGHLSDLINLLERFQPKTLSGPASSGWIGHDEFENIVLTDHYQLVTLDYNQILRDLRHLQEESKVITDPNYVSTQANWLFENVWDRRYCWE